MTDHETKEILQRLARIEQRLEDLNIPSAAQCAVHGAELKALGKKMGVLEAQVGRHNMISGTIGAVAAGIVLALKYALTR